MQIDSIIAQADCSPTTPSRNIRREKIYCDKWIHEGVCAFTQLGCKYKHEMPMDKATQLSLGLNHGLPSWYKRAQSVQIRPESQSSDSASSSTRTSGPWRRANTGLSSPTSPPTRVRFNVSPSMCEPCCSTYNKTTNKALAVNGPQYSAPSFGPIAPPVPLMRAQNSSRLAKNSFSLLQSDLKTDDEEEDKSYVWRGRGR